MADKTLDWSFGLRGNNGKYLTMEAHLNALNFNGPNMKKKQIFFLEQDAADASIVYIRTWRNTYVGVKNPGTLDSTCNADSAEKGDDQKWVIEAQDDGTWCLKTPDFNYMRFEKGGERIGCQNAEKDPEGSSVFIVHLAMHPQVNIKNVNRKRYIHLAAEGDRVTCDEDAPWGDDAMITLNFFNDGSYGLMACNGKYVQNTGELGAEGSGDGVKWTLEFHGGKLAFRSKANKKFLTCVGGPGLCRADKEQAGSDEIFVLEDSRPQIKMTSWQGKKVSLFGGAEVGADQKETRDTEIFQIATTPSGKWSIMGKNKGGHIVYFRESNGSIMADQSDVTPEAEFEIEWLQNCLAIKAAGKYITVKKNGKLAANSDSITDEAKFVYEMVNRPRLILRGAYGFINELPSSVLECNKATYQTYVMHVKAGECQISSQNGKYWSVNADRSVVSVNGGAPTAFYLTFVEDSKFAVSYIDNGETYYMTGEQNGGLSFSSKAIGNNSTWEF